MSNVTKLALKNSLKNLLRQKPLAKITINDIAEDCGISRMTFYYHFKDIYDLVEWTCVEDARRVLEGKKTYDTWQQGLIQVFQEVQENKLLVVNVYRSISREQVEDYLYKLVYRFLMDIVSEQAAGMHVSQEDQEYIVHFYKFAFVGLMLEWIKNDMRPDPQIIVDKLDVMIHGDIRRALERMEKPQR